MCFFLLADRSFRLGDHGRYPTQSRDAHTIIKPNIDPAAIKHAGGEPIGDRTPTAR